MRIVLHIGTARTGSTALQGFLALNRPALRARGICFSTAAGGNNHVKLVAYALRDDKRDISRRSFGIAGAVDVARFRAAFAGELGAEIDRHRPAVLVLSNELCSTRLFEAGEIGRLAAFLRGFSDEITVVLYLRRQDDYAVSLYTTAVKSGSAAKIALPPEQTVRERFIYSVLVDRWAAAFGKNTMVVRIYDRRRFRGGNVIADFCAALGIDDLAGFTVAAADTNRSLDARSLEFLRRLNGFLPLFEGEALSPHRGDIARLMEEIGRPGPTLTLPDEVLERFMSRFRVSNAQVADAYFGGREARGDPLFGERAQPPGSVLGTTLALDDALAFAAELWKHKHAQAMQLQQTADGLRSELAALGDA